MPERGLRHGNKFRKCSPTRVLAKKCSHLVTCSQNRVSTLDSTSAGLPFRFNEQRLYLGMIYSLGPYAFRARLYVGVRGGRGRGRGCGDGASRS